MILVNLFYNKRKEILKKYRSEIGLSTPWHHQKLLNCHLSQYSSKTLNSILIFQRCLPHAPICQVRIQALEATVSALRVFGVLSHLNPDLSHYPGKMTLIFLFVPNNHNCILLELERRSFYLLSILIELWEWKLKKAEVL